MSKYNYYTCHELIKRHPMVKLWGWNEAKVGVFYSCLLLDGKKFGKRSRTLITESSFECLKAFVINSTQCCDDNPEFMSYDEIMELVPQAELYRWNTSFIGIFYHSALISGKKCKKENRCLVSKASVARLIHYTNQRFYEISQKRA